MNQNNLKTRYKFTVYSAMAPVVFLTLVFFMVTARYPHEKDLLLSLNSGKAWLALLFFSAVSALYFGLVGFLSGYVYEKLFLKNRIAAYLLSLAIYILAIFIIINLIDGLEYDILKNNK